MRQHLQTALNKLAQAGLTADASRELAFLLAAVELSAGGFPPCYTGTSHVDPSHCEHRAAGRKAQGVTLAVAGIAVSWHPEAAYYIRLRHSTGGQPPAEEAAAMQAAVGQMLQGGDGTEQKVPEKVCFDLKGQLKALIVGEAPAAGIPAWCESSSWPGRRDQSLRENISYLGTTADG